MSRLSPGCRWPLYRDCQDGTVPVSKWIHRRDRKMGKEAVRCFCLFFHEHVSFSKHSASRTFPVVSVARLVLTPHSSCSSIKKNYNPTMASGFPGGSRVKNLPANAADASSIPGSRRSPGEGKSNPLQHSCWEIPWTEMPGGLQSMGSQRVRHDQVTKQ